MVFSFLALTLASGGGRIGWDQGVPGSLKGWEATSRTERYTASDLHRYLNGGAAKYLAYSIQELRVQDYRRESDGFGATLEIYRMDSPRNAFGLYSCDRPGTHPEGIGEEASYAGGLLQFHQSRFYVRVQALDPSGETAPSVLELGASVSKELPEGGSSPPELASTMPAGGLVEDSLCFFHNQVTLNSICYLSSENILNLSMETDAVTAEYRTGSEAFARVIVVCYNDAESAEGALSAFKDAYAENKEGSQGVYASTRGGKLVIVLDAANDGEASELGLNVMQTCECGRRPEGEESK